jgi:hypothetical protein
MATKPPVASLPDEAAKRCRVADEYVRDAEHAVWVIETWPVLWLSALARKNRRGHVRRIRDSAVRLDVRGRAQRFADHVATANDYDTPPHEFWQVARNLNDAIIKALEEMGQAFDRASAFVDDVIANVRADVNTFETRFLEWQGRSESLCTQVMRWPTEWLTYDQCLEQGNIAATSHQVDERLAIVLGGLSDIRRGAPNTAEPHKIDGTLLTQIQSLDVHAVIAEKCLLDLEGMGRKFLEEVPKTALTSPQELTPSYCISHWTCTARMLCDLRLAARRPKRRRRITRNHIDELVFNAQVGMFHQKQLIDRDKAAGRTPNMAPAQFLSMLIVEACQYRERQFPDETPPGRDERRIAYFAERQIFMVGGSPFRIPATGTYETLQGAISRLASLAPLVDKKLKRSVTLNVPID